MTLDFSGTSVKNIPIEEPQSMSLGREASQHLANWLLEAARKAKSREKQDNTVILRGEVPMDRTKLTLSPSKNRIAFDISETIQNCEESLVSRDTNGYLKLDNDLNQDQIEKLTKLFE